MKYIKKGAGRCLPLLALIIFSLVQPWICLASETPVTIRGSFADTAGHEGDLLKYTLLKHPVSPSWPSATESAEVKVSKGRFEIRVKAPSDFFYLSFSLLSAEGAQKHLFYYTAGGPSFFLFSRNDSISMMISKDQQIEFSGRGAERLRCQEQLYGLDYIPLSADKRLNDLQNNGDYAAYYRFLLLFLKEHVALKRSVLESYRGQLSPEEYEQVRLDGTGHAFLPLLRGLRFTGVYKDAGARFPYARHLLEEFGKGPWTQQGAGVLQSAYYSRFLFELECATLEFNGTDTARNNFSFADLYRRIKERYQGPVRDKLMLFAFVEQAKKRGGYERYLRAELDSMPDSRWKGLLVQWEKSAAGGTPAFPFELPDTSGKTYSPGGFRGRVVVADFWFTGCPGCIRMRDPLKAVFDSFRDNPAVVFLSINVDKVKRWWLSGLAQGKYTFPGQIELSTWGLGNDHPMLKYYNFSAYPQLLVWDKEGRSVSRSFLDPRVDGGADLRKLIMEMLAAP